MGQHWVQDCPTQGDPNFDRRRVRPAIGIPMTRLALSSEGGLVLPGGQMGTLVANEDAFAREMLGLPSAALTAAAQQQQAADANAAAAQLQQQQQQQQPVLLLDCKPAAAAAATAAAASQQPVIKLEGHGAATTAAAPAAAASGAAAAAVVPLLAGEAQMSALMPQPFGGGGAAPPSVAPMPGAAFFSMQMQSALMPRGPPDFLGIAFDRREPMSRAGAPGMGTGGPVPACFVQLCTAAELCSAASLTLCSLPFPLTVCRI